MIVDDDPIVRDTLTVALEPDFQVREAGSGEATLAMLA